MLSPAFKTVDAPLLRRCQLLFYTLMYGYVTHGSWFKWVMGKVSYGSRGSWVKLRNPSSTLVGAFYSECTIVSDKYNWRRRTIVDLLIPWLKSDEQSIGFTAVECQTYERQIITRSYVRYNSLLLFKCDGSEYERWFLHFQIPM
jgi:hypothetical protein